MAHDRPHREGGSRERDNAYHLCTVHHTLLDADVIKASGRKEAPTFELRSDGRDLSERLSDPDPPGSV